MINNTQDLKLGEIFWISFTFLISYDIPDKLHKFETLEYAKQSCTMVIHCVGVAKKGDLYYTAWLVKSKPSDSNDFYMLKC